MQVNRLPLDQWSTREKLCLCSAVSQSGDQNWMSVSRTLKTVCGASGPERPADWYSQKSCAQQYGHLLETIGETPKRKKRSSESGNGSPAAVETSTDLLLRRLTEERTQELKAIMRKEQEEYAQLYADIKALQNSQMSEEQLRQMWQEMEKQEEAQRIDEMKLENQMREREQKRQQSWRGISEHQKSTDTTAIDMDVEEIIVGGSAQATSKPGNLNIHAPTATSPLLSSLLKSPTSTGAPAVPATATRNTAPTITTLLTSGSIPPSSQPTITLKNTFSPAKAAQLLTRPISGSILDVVMVAPPQQTLLSPSQSAPTLSMLLEKSKAASAANVASAAQSASSNNDTSQALDKSNKSPPATNENLQNQNSNSTPFPMDIEDSSSKFSPAVDSDDPNEEQQLLEVFKNIGNIDELDIDVSAVIDDEEVDFLKGVEDDDILGSSEEVMEFENSAEAVTESQDKKAADTEVLSDLLINSSTANAAAQPTTAKPESSDDSNDNLPLATVASLESHKSSDSFSNQERNFLKEKEESAINSSTNEVELRGDEEELQAECPSVEDSSSSQDKIEAIVEANDDDDDDVKVENEDDVAAKNTDDTLNENQLTEEMEEEAETEVEFAASIADAEDNSEIVKLSPESEHSDVIIIPTTDDDEYSNDAQQNNQVDASKNEDNENEQRENNDEEMSSTQIDRFEEPKMVTKVSERLATPTNTQCSEDQDAAVVDDDVDVTDDMLVEKETDVREEYAASVTEECVTSIHEDSCSNSATENSSKQQTIGAQADEKLTAGSDSKAINEDDSSQSNANVCATPVRPPMIRKLRDRDRSESPLIEDENTATSDHSINTNANQRSRRRYSSTPVNDSIPNSPVSSDREERDTRSTRKTMLNIYNTLQPSKYAAIFQRNLMSEEEQKKFDAVCLRPLDWSSIKRNIDSGSIRSVVELQRDIMLMCQNAIVFYSTNSKKHRAAQLFMQEILSIREFSIANIKRRTSSANRENTPITTHPSSSSSSHSSASQRAKEHRRSESRETRESRSSSTASLNASTTSSERTTKARSGSRKSQRIS